MKKYVSLLLSLIIMFSCCVFSVNAEEDIVVPELIDSSFVSPTVEVENSSDDSRATGLIHSYSLSLSKTGSALNIYAKTYCNSEVVKCGFKNLVIERKKSSSSSWSEYYDYGDLYIDANTAAYSATIVVESGYQYRLSCKHYAKKSLLVTQSISNTSNIVTV